MKKQYLFILLLSLFNHSIWSATVSQEKAESIAKQFHSLLYQSNLDENDITCELVYTGITQTRSTSPSYYVFNYDAGFVIVAGNDLSTPILGYSASNKFVTIDIPSHVLYWMDLYDKQIQELNTLTGDAHEGWDDLSSVMFTDVTDANLLTTVLWNQGAPYNDQCPLIDGERAVTGCVATAFSIAMKYHEWPDIGTGSYSYTWNDSTLSADFDITYQWDEMLDGYTGTYTTEQADAVATIMYHAGVLSNMDYAVGGSGAHTNNGVKGIVNYMKYDKSAIQLFRSWYSDDEWATMLKAEINANRPLVYGGYDTTLGGHQFILDGYQNNYFHINWGWSGSSDGYYLIGALNPYDKTADSGGYSSGEGGVFYMQPETDNSTYTYLWVFGPGDYNDISYNGLTTSVTHFQQNVEFDLNAGVYYNQSITSFTGYLCIKHCDSEGNIKEDVSGLYSVSDFSEGQGSFHTFVCKITQEIEAGDYICMMSKSSDSDEWKMVIGDSGTVTKLDIYTATTIDVEKMSEQIVIQHSGTYLTIQSGDIPLISIQVCDVSGRIIEYSDNLNKNKTEIPIDHLSAGVYILRYQTKDGFGHYKFIR